VKDNQPLQNPELPENYAAKLAVIAAAITTLGDGLSTIAAAIALQDEENENNQKYQNQVNYSRQFDQIQRELDQMSLRIDKLERRK